MDNPTFPTPAVPGLALADHAAVSPATRTRLLARVRVGDQTRDALALAVLLVAGLIVGAAATRAGLIDPFLLFRLARVEAWLHTGTFVPYGLNVGVFDEQKPLYELILAAIATATGLSPMQIGLLPIGAVVLPMACYAVGSRVLNDRAAACLLAVAFLGNHAFATVNLGTFVYVYSTILMFAFMALLWRAVSGGKSLGLVLLLAAVFLATESLYQTTATWMIMALVALSVIAWGRAKLGGRRERVVAMGALTAAFMAYFLYFDRSFQSAFLAALGRNGAGSQLAGAIGQLIGQLSLGFWSTPITLVPYQVSAPTSSIAVGVVLTQYGLMALAGLVGLVGLVRRRFRIRPDSAPGWILLSVVVVSAIGHTVSYALYGQFSPRLISMLGGLMAALFLVNVGFRPALIRTFALVLAVVSVMGLTTFIARAPGTITEQATRDASAWLLAQADEPQITADLGLYGRLLMVASAEGRTIQLAALDSCGFAHLIEAAPACGSATLGEYLVLDQNHLDQGLQSIAWRSFGPPSKYWTQITSNPIQHVVYEQGGIVILRRTSHAS